MIKSAYQLGIIRAMRDAGIKLSGDDANLYDGTNGQQNPAETLAAIFQEGGDSLPQIAPDNKTRLDGAKPEDNPPHWGAQQQGNNGQTTGMSGTPGAGIPTGGAV